MKRPIASRWSQAGIAAPAGAAALWFATKPFGRLAAQSSDYMPHGYCYMWNPAIVWLHVISDGLITLSYYAIPIILLYFVRHNRDLPFNRIFWMFAGFILACGTTHLMEIWNIWHASYVLAGAIKAATAAISVVTAAMMVPLVPRVMFLPKLVALQEANRRLEQEIAERRRFDAPIDGPLRRQVAAGCVAAVVLTVFTGFSAWRGSRHSEEDLVWVTHTYAVMDATAVLSTDLIEAETAARAFALSGESALLARYDKAKSVVAADEKYVRDLTSDNPSQQRRLDLLEAEVSAGFAFAESIIVKRKEQGHPGGADALEVQRLIDVAHVTTDDIRAEENRLLRQRMQKFVAGRQLTRLMAVLGVFVGSIFWILAMFAVDREINVSARARTQLRTLNAELEKRVEQRTATLESEVIERKRAADALQEQARILDLAQVLVRDLDGRIVLWSLGSEKLYGFSREEALGQVSHDLLQTDFPQPLEEIRKKLRSNGGWEGELTHRKRDGSRVIVASVWSLHRDAQGQPLRILESNADITARKHAEEQLVAQTEELMRSRQSLEMQALTLSSILDSLEEGLAVADEQGKFIFWNAAGDRIGGPCVTDVTVADWAMHYGFYQPDMVTPVASGEDPLARAVRGESCTAEMFWRNAAIPEGVWIEASANPLRDRAGLLRGGIMAFRDVTQTKSAQREVAVKAQQLEHSQQLLEEQRVMLQSVLNSMEEGLVATDERGQFVIWNPAAVRILGLEAANVPSQAWTMHYGLYEKDAVTPFPEQRLPLVRAIRGETCTEEMFVRNPALEGGCWIEVSGGPVKDASGKVRGGVVAFRDVTRRKTDEEQIRGLNEDLEEKVAQRTAQLEVANHELEAFTYSVSHDLRAPLRHIGGFSRILLEDFGPTMPEEALGYLKRVEDGVQRMGLLVDELLNLARVGRHALKLQNTGLNSVIEEVVTLLQPETSGRRITWKIAELSHVQCDPILIKQVFQNLLANAIKFTKPRENAVIEIGEIQENGEVAFFVRDNGVGFDMKYKDKLFGVFQRLHRAEDFTGTGIGLATVQRIINKHNGRVWPEAELDKGATFYFTVAAGESDLHKKSLDRGDKTRTAPAGGQG